MHSTRLLFFVFAILLLPFFGISQGFQNVVIESIDDVCFGNQSQQADAEAELIMDQIMSQMQLKRIFKIRKCSSIGNAYATILPDEDNNQAPYILYDPQWLKEMANASKTDWASIGVLAHEVGHLLSYHALNKKGSNPRWEVDADRFAGSTLAKMGSTLDEAQSMFQNYKQEEDSRTHPGRKKRLEAVRTGWMRVNNPVKKILLNEDTPERDVTPELIVNRYYKSLGGLKALSQIKQLNFKETISETRGDNLNQEPRVYAYDYQQTVNKIAVLYEEGEEQYMIKNDSLFWKYTNQDKWKIGAPRIGTSLDQDEYTFKKDKKPSTENFFDDFLLISNPEVASYLGRKRIDEEECFLLEFKEEKIEIGNLNKRGKRILVSKQYYFSTQSGFLYGIVEKEKIAEFKKGKPKNQKTIETKKIITDYALLNDIYFPETIKATETELVYDRPKEDDRLYQQRSISDVELKTEANQ